MARSSEHLDSSAQTEPAGMNLQTDEAKAMASCGDNGRKCCP